jgi:Salmonella virulence plasmid 65kDa B protein
MHSGTSSNFHFVASVASLATLLYAGAAHAILGDGGLVGTTPAAEEPDGVFLGSYRRAMPIEVPPFHGLEPALALVYDSGAANGFVGVGWSLAGPSIIERGSAGRGAPKYDASDVYYLDGEELVPCRALGGTHCTRIQTHRRITFDGVNWYVWQKDGTKLTFSKAYGVSPGPDGIWGTADDVAWKWALTSVVDTHGNTVTYNWGVNQFGCCWLYPDSVVYNKGVVVKFYWELRSDRETRANGPGFETVYGRIKTIDVTANGNRLRAYRLNYGTSAGTNRSLLANLDRW